MEGKINEEMENLLEDINYNSKVVFNESFPDKVELVLKDNYEIKVEDGKTYVVRKKPQYPKTYEECCEFLNISLHNGLCISIHRESDYISTQEEKLFDKINSLYKLIICRNAYWKIAGEQIGLGYSWNPDYKNPDIDLYVIINIYNRVEKAKYGYGFQHCLFAFPSEEMCDVFKENFDKDIDFYKELF